LEQQLQGWTGASASASASGASPSQITVKIPRERKLRKFEGSRDDHTTQEWILDAERATTGHTDADAVDFLMYHLEGVPREEVCPVTLRKEPTKQQFVRSFAAYLEKGSPLPGPRGSSLSIDRWESILEYSHALLLLLACVEHLDPSGVNVQKQFEETYSLEET